MQIRGIRTPAACALLAGVAVVLSSAGPAVAAAQGPGGGTVVAHYTFDRTTEGGAFADETGRGHHLRPSGGRGGKVVRTRHDAGRAVAFPRRCGKRGCPHAVLQARHAPDLVPGAGPIRYGASVRLARKQTSAGQNVLQKGYSTRGSQYKLQVDGGAGRPSCVLVGDWLPTIFVAYSAVPIADGSWHRVECRRAGAELTILVDDVPTGGTTVPATLAITNGAPLSIGGKGPGGDNDQYHGALDDIWIAMG